jgi:hypothetical protein
MRRSLLLATLVALLAGLTVTAVTVAGGRDTDRPDRADRADRPAAGSSAFERTHARFGRRDRRGGRGRHGHGHGMLHAQLLGGLATRLDVTPAQLRDALKGLKRRSLDRAVARGTITAAQRQALDRCMADRATCDRAAARPAFRALRRDARRGDLGARKDELAEDLAAELGKTPEQVLTAVRAELVAKLDLGVTFGAVTAKGRDLALACFDEPASCDRAALRREVRMGHGRRHRR